MSVLENGFHGQGLGQGPLNFRIMCQEGDRSDLSVLFKAPLSLALDLKWWNNKGRLSKGISIPQKEEWGTVIGSLHVLGKWFQVAGVVVFSVLQLGLLTGPLENEELSRWESDKGFFFYKMSLAWVANREGTRSGHMFHLVRSVCVDWSTTPLSNTNAFWETRMCWLIPLAG